MAFDSTISGPNTTSYVSVSDADSYFLLQLDGPTFWSTLPTATKQAALTQATNRLDAELYSGRPTTDEQRLQWPRSFVVSRNQYPSQDIVAFIGGQYYIDSHIIPKELADATCEQALHYLKINAGEFTVDENDLETLKTYKLGPIDVTIKDNVKADRIPSKVKSLLKAIGMDAWLGEQPITMVR